MPWRATISEVTIERPWHIGSWMDALERPEIVDEAIHRDDEYAGLGLIALVLNHPDPEVVLPRIKQALVSPRAQTRANALQCTGHYARLHATIDPELMALLRHALTDRTRVGRAGGFRIRGYADDAADDVGYYAPRRKLPRWFRRRYPGPRRRSFSLAARRA